MDCFRTELQVNGKARDQSMTQSHTHPTSYQANFEGTLVKLQTVSTYFDVLASISASHYLPG